MRRRSFGIALATVGAVTLVQVLGVFETLELAVRDLALSIVPAKPAEATIVVGIDERSLRTVGPWPWSRSVLAELIHGAADGGATAMIVDILLADPRPGDEQLVSAMRRIPTVTVSVLDESGEWLNPTPAITAASARVGHGNFELDHDGILRRFATMKQSRDQPKTALALAAASLHTPVTVAVGRTIAPSFRTRPRSVPVISAVSVLRDARATNALRGKLVFLGPTAYAVGDRVFTPVTAGVLPDPGVVVHASATESVLRGEAVRQVAPISAGGMAGASVGLILLVRHARKIRLAISGFLALLVIGGGFVLLATSGHAIPFVTLLLCVILTEAALMTAALRESRSAAGRMEQALGIGPRRDGYGVGPRLEEIATYLAARQASETESRRVLAHELKTPLASMRGLTQLLSSYDLSEPERQRVTTLLETEADKLQSMVTVLLDLERLPLSDFHSSASILDLGDLVHARIAFLQASSRRTLETHIADGVTVRGDAALLERVVDNLAMNALKYSPPPSPVTIVVREIGGHAVIEVEDRGPGIREADRERLFQRFFRGTAARGTEGLGLGLALVAEVARWHGGSVSVDDGSRAGGHSGARFRFELPSARVAAQAGGM